MATIISNTLCDCGFDLEADLAECEYASGGQLTAEERQAASFDIITLALIGDPHTPEHESFLRQLRDPYFDSWRADLNTAFGL